MRRSVPPVPRRASFVRLLSGAVVAVGIAFTTISAQIPGRNINMVAGNAWPDGDPYLQRQNEPSIAASTRNPLHLLGGANDYRTVDLPGIAEDETGDAWLGLFKSSDGGQRWTSTLLPGYPQDTTDEGRLSPIHGYGAGADPVVRAGTNGLMYYAGLAFDRSNPATPEIPGKSAIFVARYIDNNNNEAGDSFHYLGTQTMQVDRGGKTGNFLDKPWMVVDIPRDNKRCSIVTTSTKGSITQNIPAGPVYVSYTLRSTDKDGARYDIMFSRSVDCGASWTTPVRLNDIAQRANQGASMAVDPRNGNVYIGWRQFDLSSNNSGTDALVVAKYTLGSNKAIPVGFARKFAKPKNGKGKGLDLTHFFQKGGVNTALQAAELSPLDQSTSALQIRFRTNAYPSMTVDETGRVYMVWAERGYDPLAPSPIFGSARVLIATSPDGATWTTARTVSSENQKGHQLMPSLTYAGGRLMLIYYDIRETRSQSFTQFIDDRSSFNAPDDTDPNTNSTGLRHTIDLRASMATPGAIPAFAPSVAVSEYIEGPRTANGPNVPLQVNPPNLPMFQKGTAPFIGDYVDIAAAPTFVVNASGTWSYNTAATTTPPIFHAAWTDNRDVRVPLVDISGPNGVPDGNPWNDYTPVGKFGGTPSIFDPTKVVPQCVDGNAGSRNQNVYTARISGGLLVGSPGNNKRLGVRADENGAPLTELLQRSFVVFAQNTTDVARRFRFTITNQPVGGRASFDQFSAQPLTSIDAEIPYRSTASRTVYATSTDPHAVINITVAELVLVNGVWQVKSGGLAGIIILNPDIDNPDIDNPDVDNPDIDNPDIDNAEVYNPDIDNPDIDNPDIDNPDIDNPDIDNPDVDNIRVANPDIDNPDIDNPDIDNPDIDNPDIDNPDIDNPDIDNASLMTDVTWAITNTGNTTASYNINLFFAQQTFDPDINTQLILYRTYKTPVVRGCELKSETHNVLVANIPDPHLVTPNSGGVSDPNDPEITNATIFLAPGETAKITLRVFDPAPDPGSIVTVTNPDGSTAKIVSSFVPNEDVTPVVQQQSVNTEDVNEGVTEPPIVVQFPAPQTVPDSGSTAVNTPITFNVLANDSSAFGSTKVISFHPAGMGAHSGTGAGEVAYQPTSGYVYTTRGAVDPVSNTLVGRFPLPPGNVGIAATAPNPRTGINYSRSSQIGAGLSAMDARPASPTFHQYLPMPALSDLIIAMALDPVNARLYAVHTPSALAITNPSTISVIDVNPASGTFHTVVGAFALPLGIRPQSIAVNTRTQKVYVASTNINTSTNGGVYVADGLNLLAAPVRITNTTAAWGMAVNESANLVFASTSVVGGAFGLYAIDGVTNAATVISSAVPMRFGANEERLVVHEATGKVLMRLQNTVVIIDGQRGSPTRNTVVATINVGRDSGTAEIAIDQELGLAVTVGNFDFQIDVIDIGLNALSASYFPNQGPTEVTIDPINHRAFVSVFTYVQEIELAPLTLGSAIPVFIESGGLVINPISNKAYAGLFVTSGAVAKISGAGFGGFIPGVNPRSRYLFSERYNAANWYFITGQGYAVPEASEPGMLLLIDGATDSPHPDIVDLETPPFPFGIGIDQTSNEGYVATLAGLTHGQLIHGDLSALDDPDNGAEAQGVGGPLPSGFPLNGTGALLSFGRHVVVNPVNHKVYVLQIGGSPTSVAVFTPADNILRPLDGQAGTPLFDYQLANAGGGQAWGRAQVIRVNTALNRVYMGFVDTTLTITRVVAIDSATDTVVGTWVGGAHSFRHTASFIIVNQASNLLYVSDYNSDTVTMLDASTLAVLGTVNVAEGPSAMAFNPTANRLYVSSIDSKTLTAIDGSTLTVTGTVRLPLVAYFLYVDEIESRVYTSGGDSADESGVMVVTDILGKLGTNVSVTSVGSALHGTVALNPDYSVTYTPLPGYSGPDQFTYNIAAPTGTAIGTVSVTVAAPSTALLALPDSYSVTAGQTLNISAPGPLANDPSSAGASMAIVAAPEGGSLTPQANGSFQYQPFVEFTGIDSFTYRLTTVAGVSNTVKVSIAVNPATTFVVVNTNDSGAGSLRQAIINANMEPGAVISFSIPGGGLRTIQPTSALPAITSPITIDGYTQPGASANTAAVGTNAVLTIQLRGTSAGGGVNGLTVNGGGTTIRGLNIGGYGGTGILLDFVGNNVVEGNFLGTNETGTAALANGNSGVISQSANNLIGGTTLAARNLLSGNNPNNGVRVQGRNSGGVIVNDGGGTMIKGNLIGTTASGLAALPNSSGISVQVANVTIGGLTPLERNVISGNSTGINSFATSSNGVVLATPANLIVRGNYIGLRADGSAALANTSTGANISGANSVIGGTAGTTPGACTGACNVISGNGGTGLSVTNNFENASSAFVPLGTIYSSASATQVLGNFIGVDPTGTTAVPNVTGVNVSAPNVIVGSGLAGARNVISGNSGTGLSLTSNSVTTTGALVANGQGAIVRGNYIGITADGLSARGNGSNGIGVNPPNVTIGGTNAADRNVIAGNTNWGISSSASVPTVGGVPLAVAIAVPSNMIVQGNYLGTRADGTVAIPNGSGGVIVAGPNALVGGMVGTSVAACTGACNLVSGNTNVTGGSTGVSIGTHFDNTTGSPQLGTVYSTPTGTQVLGNFIGVNLTGTSALPNDYGIIDNAPGTFIGGPGALERNVISGNLRNGINLGANYVTTTNMLINTATGTQVRGNLVGVNAAGTALISNGFSAIFSAAPNVTIGGPNAADRNVAAGNGGGISLGRQFNGAALITAGGTNTVQGNIVGLTADGLTRLSASGTGVAVQSADNQIVGNIVSGQGLPASNSTTGIMINTAAATGNSVRGNIVGTNASGDAGLGNAGSGISIIDASNNTVGGPTAQDRNIVVGSVNDAGIILFASATGTVSGNVVKNNYVGVKADGLTANPNRNGVAMNVSAGGIITNNLIGGATAADRNVISGNNIAGVNIDGVAPTANQIAGNYIGVAADGVTPRGNALMGVRVNASNNLIGGLTAAEGNLIAFNSTGGIDVTTTASRNRLLYNVVYGNTGLGIDLNQNGVTANDAGDGDTGANNLQNFPVLSAATNTGGPTTGVTTDLSSFAAGNYTIQFFASVSCDGSGFGEGERLVGHFINVAAGGTPSFFLSEVVPVGQFITATATDALGNTSEYSQCRAVTP